MAIDATVVALFDADLASAARRRDADNDHSLARMRDANDHVGQLITGFIGLKLYESDTGMEDSILNAAMRTPNDLGPATGTK